MSPRQYDDDPDDNDYEDDRPSRRGRRSRSGGERPGKVQAIAIMTLIGGIMACVYSGIGLLLLLFYGIVGGIATMGIGCLCLLWPGPYYGVTIGILATIKGAQLLGQRAQSLPPPKGTAIMMIINIINLDVVNCVLGILILVFCSDPEVDQWYRG